MAPTRLALFLHKTRSQASVELCVYRTAPTPLLSSCRCLGVEGRHMGCMEGRTSAKVYFLQTQDSQNQRAAPGRGTGARRGVAATTQTLRNKLSIDSHAEDVGRKLPRGQIPAATLLVCYRYGRLRRGGSG